MRAAKVIAALIFATLAAGLGKLWLMRRTLPYGPEGQYFDAASGISYSDGTVTVVAAATIITGALAIVTAYAAWQP